MPTGLERRQQTGQLHLITFSCFGRNPYLYAARAANTFLHSLEAIRSKYRLRILGYVVMPEHVHLLMHEPPTHPLSTLIGALKRSVSKKLPESPFWLARYHDANIGSAQPRIEALRYLHRNPVERGLVEKPEEYEWSSFRAYAFNERGIVQITRAF